MPLRTRDALLTVAPEEKFAAAATGVLLYTHDTAAAGAAIEARIIGADVGAEALIALAGAAVEFDRPGEGAHEFFIDLLHEHGRPARLTLRFEIADGALDSQSLGAQTVFVAKGEFCR
jgi:trans-2,3-dihydro-3-hydroxyanthranilate isomerase